MIHFLFPVTSKTSVYETDFSFEFCFNRLREISSLFGGKLSLYKNNDDLTSKIASGPETAIVFQRPDIVISRYTVELLVSQASKHDVVVPVYNESSNSQQQIQIPFMYHDLYTFDELCRFLQTHHPFTVVETKNPDLSLFACKSEKINLALERKRAFVCRGAYAHKFESYYDSPREDLIELVPPDTHKVLDVGCAKGAYGRRLKELRKDVQVYGVELNPLLAKEAEKHYHKVWNTKFEDLNTNDKFDLINIGDVLEHIYDTDSAIKKMYNLLKPGGYVVGSIPNASHWSIIRQLLSGDFQYVPTGLLCISHIRFFTEKTLIDAFTKHGFQLELIKRQKDVLSPSGRSFVSSLRSYLNARADLETVEILFRFRKPLQNISETRL